MSTSSLSIPPASATAQWLRLWLAPVVGLLAVVSVLTAFTEDMPSSHHVAAPLAVVVMGAAWSAEIAGLRLPRWALVLATVVPTTALALIGHVSANLLFLLLLVAWVGMVGSALEHALALGLSLATLGIGLALDVASGQVHWTTWIMSTVVLVLASLMALVLRRQDRLLLALARSRAEAEQRSQELESLLDVSRTVASSLEMVPLLENVLDALGTVVEYSGTAILRLDEGGETLSFAHMRGPASFTPEMARPIRYRVADMQTFWDTLRGDEPVVIPDIRADTSAAATFRRMVGETDLGTTYSFIRSVMWIPLVVRGQILGLLSITNPTPGAFGARDAALSLAVARQAAVALENARLHERARQAAVLEERQRLARELHDSVTQSLYGVSLYAEAGSRALTAGEVEPAAAYLRDIRETTHEALAETRLLLFELRPPLLEEHGLAGALRSRLQAVEGRAGLVTAFDSRGDTRLSPEREQELYRLAQEALNNVLKHAHAQRVDVRLDLTCDPVVLEIADDGAGFEPDLLGGGGFGLPGMRERAERLGGTLRLDSAPGAGTCVRVTVPR